MTLSISDTRHKIARYCAKCHYAECRILFIIMLSVIISDCSGAFQNPFGRKLMAPFLITISK
jgi:hypothetical protein